MPYPNEHAARIIEPEKFEEKTIRRKTIADGINIIIGKLIGDDKMTVQAYRFDKEKYSPSQAEKWLKKHKISFIKFEEAEEPKTNSDIKILNEEIKNNSHNIVANMSNLIEKKEMDGKRYLVCPAVLITEGVHNGVFYPAEELSKFPEAWNGRPVSVYHPTMAGKPITANSPEVIEKQVIGQLFNTRFEDGKLKSEIWIDIEKAQKNHPEILAKLNQNLPVEVSTGLFTEDEYLPNENKWKDESYFVIARNFRPDHLALLPDGVGACSWADGAGMPRINKEQSPMITVQSEEFSHNENKIKKMEDNVERKETIEKLFVAKLIEETDKELLEKVSELLFQKIASLVEEAEEAEKKSASEAPATNQRQEPKTLQEFVENAPEIFRTELQEGLRLNAEKRNALIEVVKANKANKFSDDELKSKSTGELEKLAELAKAVKADYSVASSAPKTNVDDNRIPEMPKIEFKK